MNNYIHDINASKKENQKTHCLVKNDDTELQSQLSDVIVEYGSVSSSNQSITYSKENRKITTFIEALKYGNKSHIAQVLFLGKITIDRRKKLCEMKPYIWCYTGDFNIDLQTYSIEKNIVKLPFTRHVTDSITYEFNFNS